VSNDSANSAPTAATAHGRRTVRKRPSSLALKPFGATIASGPATSTARRFTNASPNRNTIETVAPVTSSHAGVCQPADSVPAASATRITIVPWPSEKRLPAARASRGLVRALQRVRPSIVAR
jgi:hypothetical protein